MAKIWKWLAIFALVLMVIVGSCLGYYFARTSADLGDTRADLAKANEELSSTQEELTSTQNDLQDTQNTLASTQSELKTTSDNLTTTENYLDKTQIQLETAQSQLTTAQSALTTTQNNLDSVSQQLTDLQTDIQKVYPPKYFDSYTALRNWVDNTLPKLDRGASAWNQAKQLQQLALSDGYIWSLGLATDRTFVATVIAGDRVYWVSTNGIIIDTGFMT